MLRLLISAIDWFIPADLRVSNADFWRARIFVISHMLGPCSAIAIMGYLYDVVPNTDAVFWVICGLCGAFWLLPFGLKALRALKWLALFSFCDLTFISVFGAFFYGGVSSPFLPWLLTALLIGFFYLSDRPLLVVGIVASHLSAFCVAYLLLGYFPQRVPVPDLSTVGMISVLCATLYSSMMAIYYAYVMIEQSALRLEIENHLRTAVKLRAAKAEAERADQAKAVFLAKMNHQLRTPLNAIIGYSEILLEDIEPGSDQDAEADLKTINNAGRHLLSLLSDVLYMPRIEANNISVSLRTLDVDQCLEEVMATCRNLVTHNGNQFCFQKKGQLGSIETDETRLRQILINLISNAGKFTRNGRVVLRVERYDNAAGTGVLFAVDDTGIGIPEEALPTLFTNFNPASAATAKTYGGSGLGLSVSQRLAHLLQGDISVNSTIGQGTTFTLRLPDCGQRVAEAA
jgi:signal transduction histidine kinase